MPLHHDVEALQHILPVFLDPIAPSLVRRHTFYLAKLSKILAPRIFESSALHDFVACKMAVSGIDHTLMRSVVLGSDALWVNGVVFKRGDIEVWKPTLAMDADLEGP